MTLIHWVNRGRAPENSSCGLYMRVFWELQPTHRPRSMLELGSGVPGGGAVESVWE